jgi:hypothetical protein
MLERKNYKLTSVIIIVSFVSIIFFVNINFLYASDITSEKMIDLTNQSRKEAGLKTLNVSSKLNLAAEKKADDMLDKQYFEHVSPDGITPWYWFGLVGYDYIYAAENLAIDFSTAEGAHSALMKSAGHRENILGASYKDIGIAIVTGTFNNKESTIIVEEFGATKNEDQGNDELFDTSTTQPETTIVIPKLNIQENKTGTNMKNVCSEKSGCDKKLKTAAPVVKKINNLDQPIINEQDTAHKQNNNARQNIEPKPESENIQDSYGKIIPTIYSVKELRMLKKCYTDNIYWTKAEAENYLGQSINGYRARLKYILKNMLKGHCCSPIN